MNRISQRFYWITNLTVVKFAKKKKSATAAAAAVVANGVRE